MFSIHKRADPEARMANVLRGIIVLFAVTAVLNAASIEEKLSSVEDTPSNLGKAATDQSHDLVEDPADINAESEGGL